MCHYTCYLTKPELDFDIQSSATPFGQTTIEANYQVFWITQFLFSYEEIQMANFKDIKVR